MKILSILSSCTILTATSFAAETSEVKKPNFIIIFSDDQGYQDLGCYGAPDFETPHIDKMASEGLKLTSFYAQTVCGPSRAALMTGCYPLRIGRSDDGKNPHPEIALSEITIPEMLKQKGYATGMVGKWDLGGHSTKDFKMSLRPQAQGFDFTFWTPSSNDKIVNLYDGENLLEKKADMALLTKRYTDKSIEFITAQKDNPFFLYVAHTMPHTILDASEDFKGKSKGGLYGDVIEELDHNVGRILQTVKDLKLDDNTYVIFTSDNGPWWIRKENGGHCAPLRGAKTSAYDGGFRVPFIIRAPGKVPAGVTSDQVIATIDMLPTLAGMAGAEAPSDRVIDGKDVTSIFTGEVKEIDRTFFYYQHRSLRAVRKGDWKLHLPHTELDKQNEGKSWLRHIAKGDRDFITEPTLYNLTTDIGETTNVAKENPEVLKELTALLEAMKKDVGGNEGRGENARALNQEH